MKQVFLAFCLILTFGISKSAAQITYSDIAPILIENCVNCHRPGGVEFSLANYSAVEFHGGSIKHAVEQGHMPPWPPDASYRTFIHEKVLTEDEKDMLITWITTGMPAGDTTLAPPLPNFSDYQLHGTPDLILRTPNITSTSTTSDKYICVNVPSGLLQDRFVRAYEFVPGNPDIIHHSVITLDTTGTAVNDLSGNCLDFQGQMILGEFAPGTGPTVFPGVAPVKMGIRMKAGTTVSFQLHIPKGTAGEQDSSELRIYLYPVGEQGVRTMTFETVLQNWNFFIPANSVRTVHAYWPKNFLGQPQPNNTPRSLYSVFGHSHTVCTSILNFAYQGTDTIPLLSIPKWDFHWQGVYTYPKMVKFPQGYTMASRHVFDNTVNNPDAPNPAQGVFPGPYTEDEMLFDGYLYTNYQAGDDTIDIAAILANDPLFFPTSTSTQENAFIQVKAYPNPFSQYINIDYSLASAQFVQLRIYNILGQEVSTVFGGIESAGSHSKQWNGRDNAGRKLPPGTYFYKLQAGKASSAGKVALQG